MAVDVQFTKFVNCDQNGDERGDVTFGYRIYDDYGRDYNNFISLQELQEFNPASVWSMIQEEHEDFVEVIEENGGFFLNDEWVEIANREVISNEA